MSHPAMPLQGVRILSVEQFGAGPFGTLALANLGARLCSTRVGGLPA